MRILLKDIPITEKEIDFDLSLEGLNQRISAASASASTASCTSSFLQAPHCEMSLRRSNTDVFINGKVNGVIHANCARCGEATDTESSSKFELILKPRPLAEEAAYEDISYGYYDAEEILCEPIAQEYLLLSIPIQILCSMECKGLCAECGANLNLNPCNCSSKSEPDERLKALWGLKV